MEPLMSTSLNHARTIAELELRLPDRSAHRRHTARAKDDEAKGINLGESFPLG
jgi:hypothetical protein